MRWSLGDFMYHLFRTHDEHKNRVKRSQQHGSVVGNFLSGNTKYTPIQIVDFWLHDAAGQPKRSNPEFSLRYSPTVPYNTLKRACVALTAMSVQLCEKRISKTVAQVRDILTEHQPVTLHLLTQLASPLPYKNEHGVVVAIELLSSVLFTHTKFARLLPAARAILFVACGVPRVVFDYCSRVGLTQSWHATYNALNHLVEDDMAYLRELGCSLLRWFILRFDNIQSYHKQRERRIGRENSMKVGIAATVAEVFDFVPAAADLKDRIRRIEANKREKLTMQQLRDLVDWENNELVAILQWVQTLVNHVPALAHYKPMVTELYETDGAKLRVPPRKTKLHSLKTVAKNEAVSTELRDALVDFLRQLGQEEGDYIPRLIPVGGNGLTFEKLVQLKEYLQFHPDEFQRFDILYPFLEIWHTIWTYLSAVFETHFGDSLTPDPSALGHSATQINQKAPPNLKKVDYYSSIYLAFTVLDARMLDCWRIHYGCEDLAEYFAGLAARGQLPTLNELRLTATTLHKRYSTQRAWADAMAGGEAADEAGWTEGTQWGGDDSERSGHTESGGATQDVERGATVGRSDDPEESVQRPAREAPVSDTIREDARRAPDADRGSGRAPRDASDDSASDSSGSTETDEEPFGGDRTLAQSILFMSDVILLRELSQAVAEGDIGRVWNAMKILIFRFAGTNHSKYTTYLLEMTCSLELESSPLLREIFLKNWLVNPSGEPGRNQEGDLFQEHVNLEIDENVTRKGAEYDSPFIRDVMAPCAIHFMELRNEWGSGVGLAKRRGRHPAPHSRPEIRTLLRVYREQQLHLFRKGRAYVTKPVTNIMREGTIKLQKQKLQKFKLASTRSRAVAHRQPPPAPTLNTDANTGTRVPLEQVIADMLNSISDSEDSTEPDNDDTNDCDELEGGDSDGYGEMGNGSTMYWEDGELVIEGGEGDDEGVDGFGDGFISGEDLMDDLELDNEDVWD
ncbi:hypothetical protein LXA43DRAFT_886661 [Ganoderma leucocontextum]|nr:hypothetical protein LXA43DRAFT_886661 [Ganoderma leucocontextum]